MANVPTIDLGDWYNPDVATRAAVAATVDGALQTAGFFMVTGHQVPAELRRGVRAAATAFFALPEPVKQRYAVTVMGRGWLPSGVEANGYAEGTPTPPDLKETFCVGADQRVGDPEVDAYWFQPNVWPAEVPALELALTAYRAQMLRLADDLLRLCAVALGQADDFFTAVSDHPTHTLNVNWYPPITVAGPALDGQYRIGPHTDFGTVTILDREPGTGGLQVWDPDGGWQDAPYDSDAFTINTGDLLAYWSGGRWISNRHRVLPPSADAPAESLISLVHFHETNHDTMVTPVSGGAEPVLAADFLRTRLDAITVG